MKKNRIILGIIILLLCMGGVFYLLGFTTHTPDEKGGACDSGEESFASQCAETDEYAYNPLTNQGCCYGIVYDRRTQGCDWFQENNSEPVITVYNLSTQCVRRGRLLDEPCVRSPPNRTAGLSPCTSPETTFVIGFPGDGISRDTAEEVKTILLDRMSLIGVQCGAVALLPEEKNKITSARIECSGADIPTLKQNICRAGRFELFIRNGSSSGERVLTNEEIANVSYPQGVLIPQTFIVVNLTGAGAGRLQTALLEQGVDRNPGAYNLSVVVDEETVFSGPLSPDMAAGVRQQPISSLAIPVDSLEEGVSIWVRLSEGPLPVDPEL